MRDIKLLVPDIQDYLDNLQRQIEEIVEESAELAVTYMVRIIEQTTSETGQKRAANGGHPGRIETGKMRSEVRSRLVSASKGAEAHAGWLDNPELYFYAQEHGGSGMPAKFIPMEAMFHAFMRAREHMFERLQAIGVEFL